MSGNPKQAFKKAHVVHSAKLDFDKVKQNPMHAQTHKT